MTRHRFRRGGLPTGIIRGLLAFALLGASFSGRWLQPGLAAQGIAASGTIGADTTWHLSDSPIDVSGNLVVASGATLTIEPGVVVRFEAGASLEIDGTLVAQGTADVPIHFTSAQTPVAPGQWKGVRFTNSSADATYDAAGTYVSGSILEFAEIDSAGAGGNPALQFTDAGPLVSHATIAGNSGAGIQITESQPASAPSQATLVQNVIENNGGYAIVANSIAGGLLIQGNTIVGNTQESTSPISTTR